MKKLINKYFSDTRQWWLQTTAGVVALVILAYIGAAVGVLSMAFLMLSLVAISAGWLVGCTFKATSLYVMRKSAAINNLTPASTLQKYALAWCISLPASLLFIVLLIWGVNTAMHHLTGVYITNEFFFGVAHLSAEIVWQGVRFYLVIAFYIHSAMLLGMTMRSSMKMGKQGIVGVAMLIVGCALVLDLPRWLGMPEGRSGFPFFFDIHVRDVLDGSSIRHTISWLSGGWHSVVSVVVIVSLPVAFWIAAYFKLKEFQVK